MAISWLEDYKRLNASKKKQATKQRVPDTLFSEMYKPSTTKESVVPGGKQMNSGRFTGYGGDGLLQKDMPTSKRMYTEHEGEYVIPADKVMKMGGPKSVDSIVQQLEMKADEVGNGLAGYQQGGVVDQNNNVAGKGQPSLVGLDTVKKTAGEISAPELTIDKIRQPETAAAQKFAGQFAGATDLLEKRAKGESPEMEKIAQTSREKMAGRQAEQEGALRQQIAQTTRPGAPGGAASAMLAINKAAQEGQLTELERGIFETKVKDMGDATGQLVNASLQGMSFEENKRQYGEQTAMQIETFNENNRRYGLDVALDIESKNWNRNMQAASTMISSGDYDGARKVLSDRGINVDFSKMEAEDQLKKFNTGITNLTASINSGFDYSNKVVQNDLKSMAESQGMDWENPDTKRWARETYENMTLANSPGYSVWGNMTDDDMVALLGPLDQLTDERSGTTGRAAANMKLTRLSFTNGLTFDANGNPQISETGFEILERKGKAEDAPEEDAPLTWDEEIGDPFDKNAKDIASDINHPQHETVINAQVEDIKESEDYGAILKAGKDSPLYKAFVGSLQQMENKPTEVWHGSWKDIDYKLPIETNIGDVINFSGKPYEVLSGASTRKHDRKGTQDWILERIKVKDLSTGQTKYLEAGSSELHIRDR